MNINTKRQYQDFTSKNKDLTRQHNHLVNIINWQIVADTCHHIEETQLMLRYEISDDASMQLFIALNYISPQCPKQKK